MMSGKSQSMIPTWIVFPIILIIELLDFGLGFIPVVGPLIGNVLDGIALFVNFLAVGPIAFIGAIEFFDLFLASIPVAGFFLAPIGGMVELIPFHLIAFFIGKLSR